MKIQKIESKTKNAVKRVAAYARVSTLSEEQEESYETQKVYYTKLIDATPNWEFAGLYTDHGLSGTSAKGRPGFMAMIEDARKKKFDLILVKSLSRFARNAKETQDYVHELKGYHIEVWFDRENLSSFDPSSEMVFNMLASMAQEEIRATSERVKWSLQKHAEMGIRHLGSNHVLGYDEIKGKLTPNEQAWMVYQIFSDYAAGVSLTDILTRLSEAGATGQTGKPMRISGLQYILRNEIYVGDRLLQKQAPRHYLTKRPDETEPYKSIYISDDHEGIVSREMWDAVQARLRKTKKAWDQGIHKRSSSHFLYGKVFCGDCGAPYSRKTLLYKGEMQKVWKCAERLKGKKGNGCKNIAVPEHELLEAISEALGVEGVDEETLKKIDLRVEIDGDNQVRIELLAA